MHNTVVQLFSKTASLIHSIIHRAFERILEIIAQSMQLISKKTEVQPERFNLEESKQYSLKHFHVSGTPQSLGGSD